MIKKQYLKLKSFFFSNQDLILFWFFLLVGMGWTLFVEYKYEYSQFKWLGWRVVFIAATIFKFGSLPKTNRKKINSFIVKFLLVFLALYLINFFVNLVNIYHLEKFNFVNQFCENNQEVCTEISDNFYKFKFYRFVSLTPYFFFYVIFLLLGMLFSRSIYQSANKIWGQIPKFKLKYAWLFYFLMAYLLFQQLVFAFSAISKKVIKLAGTLEIPFEERWEPVMGGRSSFGWVDTYANFVNSHVPKNKVILIPNQVAPWEMEGNPYYIRWFFYPRRTVQMLDSPEIPKSADYALITYGVFGFHKQVYPNFEIKADQIDEIILIDRKTLDEEFIRDKGFDPNNYEDKWGLIRLKKEK